MPFAWTVAEIHARCVGHTCRPEREMAHGRQSASMRTLGASALEFIASMRFAVASFVVICISSATGTVIEQDQSYNVYLNQFWPFWAAIFRELSVFSIYSAGWYLTLIGLMVTSTAVCVYRTRPKLVKDTYAWKAQFQIRAKAIPLKFELRTPMSRLRVAQGRQGCLKRAIARTGKYARSWSFPGPCSRRSRSRQNHSINGHFCRLRTACRVRAAFLDLQFGTKCVMQATRPKSFAPIAHRLGLNQRSKTNNAHRNPCSSAPPKLRRCRAHGRAQRLSRRLGE